MNLFAEFSIVLAVASLMTFVARLLRQPLVIGHIITGILVGPFVFGFLHSTETFTLFAEIGIAILLFTVGLNLNPQAIRDFGKIAVITGVGQVVFTSITGFLICLLLGLGMLESAYVAVALAFSSTIIILKLITERGDLETLYAKISIGFLLVQDFIAILLLFVLPLVAMPDASVSYVLQMVGAGVLAIVALLFIAARLLPRIDRYVTSSQEVLLIFTIAWGVIIATAFQYLGFSIESGALIAGVALSNLHSRDVVIARLMPIRDFFLILFFVLLGSKLMLAGLGLKVVAAVILSALVLIGNPIILMVIMGRMGFRKKTSLFTGFTVAQISEFSLILVMLGVRVGHVSEEVLSLVTLVGMITIFGSTYLILYADKIYSILSPYLGIFERRINTERHIESVQYEAVLFGCNRIGYDFMIRLKKEFKKKLLVVDSDPSIVLDVRKEKINVMLGDAADINFLESIDFAKTKIVISTLTDPYMNGLIQRVVQERNAKTKIFLTANRVRDALMHYENGVDYVVLPHLLGGKYASDLLIRTRSKNTELKSLRLKHMQYLKKRMKKGFTMSYPHQHSGW